MRYREIVRSQTAKRKGIDNTPTEEQLARIKILCEEVFEPLRNHMRHAIYISSCFRAPALNRALGGAKNSQHLADNGAAMDLDGQVFGGATNRELGDWIRLNLNFDQLIYEGWDTEYDDYAWIHVSYVNDDSNRNQSLIMYKDGDNKTKYKVFKKHEKWHSV